MIYEDAFAADENCDTDAQPGSSIAPSLGSSYKIADTTNSGYPSRRSALQAIALASAGSLLSFFAPSQAFAKPKKKYYPIIYKLRGGKNRRGQKAFIRRGKSVAVSKLKTPKRKGYGFVAWYKDKDLTKLATYVRGRSRKSKRTLYAKWKIKRYKIAYDLRGGEPTLPLPQTYTVKSPRIKPFPPMREGYLFDGWYSDELLTTRKSSIKTGSTGNVTLYAKWRPATHWNTHLDAKCAQIESLVDEISDPCPSFVFITDTHLPNNALQSPWLIKRVAEHVDIGMVVFGGDTINYCPDKQDALEMLRFTRKAFASGTFRYIRGNHDTNIESSLATKETAISGDEFRKLMSSEEGAVYGGNGYYYHQDDCDNKIRYLFADSGAPNHAYLGDVQLRWLEDRILELDDSWTVLVFIHQFFNSGKLVDGAVHHTIDKNGILLKELLDRIYDESKAHIAGVFSGHCHADWSEYSEKGYPMIATTCDAYGKSLPKETRDRVLGTTDDQAFDIVTIDTEKRMLYLTRIGSGADREFSYAPYPEQPTTPPITAATSNSQP